MATLEEEMRITDVLIGTRICQRPGCGKEFDIGYGGGRAKYCPDCRVIVMKERHREQDKRRRKRRRILKANEASRSLNW